ncbi:hypothetical protein KUTeg_002977, partial [Tegillarca granosa]
MKRRPLEAFPQRLQMLGVMTENTSVLNGDDRPQKRPKLSEDLASPQRSILDFFKGSGKSGDQSKPKDLFGYFTKVTDKGAVNCNGDVHDKKGKIQKENGPLTTEKNVNKDLDLNVKKGKKRKLSLDSKSDNSLEDFDVEDKKETFKQKRQREIAEKMKKCNGVQQEQERTKDCKLDGKLEKEEQSKCNGIDDQMGLQENAKENNENKSTTATVNDDNSEGVEDEESPENGNNSDCLEVVESPENVENSDGIEVTESPDMNMGQCGTVLDKNEKDETLEVDTDLKSGKADANNQNGDKDDKHFKKRKHKKNKDSSPVICGTENTETLSVDDKNDECKTKKKYKKNENKHENLDTSDIEKNDTSVLEGQNEESDVKKKEK